MSASLKIGGLLVALICIAVVQDASAATAKVARKCDALTAKAFPPREIGNPAAGLARGTVRAERSYFKRCVANGGHVN